MTGRPPRAGPHRVARRHGRDRGTAAVEFALVLPLLALILFGIVDFGRLLSAKLTLAQAAREGARAAALVGTEQAVLDQVSAAATDLVLAEPPAIDLCPVLPEPGSDARVTLHYRFDFVTPVGDLVGVGSGGGMDLEATGVMPCL